MKRMELREMCQHAHLTDGISQYPRFTKESSVVNNSRGTRMEKAVAPAPQSKSQEQETSKLGVAAGRGGLECCAPTFHAPP